MRICTTFSPSSLKTIAPRLSSTKRKKRSKSARSTHLPIHPPIHSSSITQPFVVCLTLVPRVQYLFCTPDTLSKTNNPSIHYFDRSRISFVVTLVITLLILVLLVVPIWILFYLTVKLDTGVADTVCIGVLLVCTLVFSCVLSLFTKAKRHEVLAAAAG